MNPIDHAIRLETRRQFFRTGAMGLGGAALAHLVSRDAFAKSGFDRLPGSDFAPKAKRAIFLMMAGAPSQLDMWDYKPQLHDRFDQDLPESVRNGQRLTTMTSKQKRFPVAPSKYKFARHGSCGTHVSELLPHTAGVVDDLCVIKSMYTEAINHDPAITYIQTGNQIPGRPSLGAWLSYGLGSDNENLPAFVVLNSTWSAKRDAQALYERLWSAGDLPSRHAGVSLRAKGDPVLYLSDPPGVPRDIRRTMLDGLQAVNAQTLERFGDPETQTRIQQYEMAFRMQASVPELTDLKSEPEHVRASYGPDVDKPGTFAYNCLLARRMAERGVRYTQIFHRGWDQHGGLPRDLPLQCKDIDQPARALIDDLRQRGMLDDTLVIWGGEFGRTVYCQGKLTRENYGRDHHPRAFTIWMAGGGIQGGLSYGETDDYSYNIVTEDQKVHIRDLNATILHLMGLDHERLSVPVQGLDVRLTGVEKAHICHDILV